MWQGVLINQFNWKVITMKRMLLTITVLLLVFFSGIAIAATTEKSGGVVKGENESYWDNRDTARDLAQTNAKNSCYKKCNDIGCNLARVKWLYNGCKTKTSSSGKTSYFCFQEAEAICACTPEKDAHTTTDKPVETKTKKEGKTTTDKAVKAKTVEEKEAPATKSVASTPIAKEIGPKEAGKDGHFVAYANGTVLDTRTNLMWAARDNGSNINWANAKSYCENYRGGGYTDWRMPTQDELARLYDAGKSYKSDCGYTARLTELIHLTCTPPWASETRGSDAAFFDFYVGKRLWYPQSGAYNLRALPVRAGK